MTRPKTIFVYIWNDHRLDKHYIGVHKGSVDDGYMCSSKTMLAEYTSRPQDFSRQIICECLTYDEALKVEREILKSVNARNNPDFYNKVNGQGPRIQPATNVDPYWYLEPTPYRRAYAPPEIQEK